MEDFSVIQILCEIKVGESTQSVLPLERIFKSALNFDFHEFLYFLKAEVYQNSVPQKKAKNVNFRTSRFCKIDFT